ncbi:TAXI family TRAP transporter solute-binding subunit [Bacteroidota bacterium]
MKRITIVISTILILSILAWGFGCAQPAPAPAPSPTPAPKPAPAEEMPKALRLSTLFAGSSAAVYGTALAALIEKHVGIPTSPENASSTLESTLLCLKGDSQIGTTSSSTVGYALKGEAPYPADSSKVMRVLFFGGYETHAQWTTIKSSNIRSFADIKGKRALIKREGDAIFEDVWPLYLKVNGLTKDDVTVMPELGLKNQGVALKEGRGDVGMHYGAAPVPKIVELNTTHSIYQLTLTEAQQKEILDSLPWVAMAHTIPGGTYKDQDHDVLTIKFTMPHIIRADVPDSLAYDIAKAVDENLDELKATHPAFKNWTMEALVNNPGTAYHAGAYKYYMDKGLLTDKSIEMHKKYLAQIGMDK